MTEKRNLDLAVKAGEHWTNRNRTVEQTEGPPKAPG